MENKGSFRLVMRQGPMPGKVFELVKDLVNVGRDLSNDIVINDSEVSRNHARLTAQAGAYQLEDLASTNGSFLNGQRVTVPRMLKPGDVVGFGETITLDYTYYSESAATIVASRAALDPSEPAPDSPPPASPPPPPPPPPPPAPPPAYSPPVDYAPAPEYAAPEPSYASPPPPSYVAAAPIPPADPLGNVPVAPPKDNKVIIGAAIGCGAIIVCCCMPTLAWVVLGPTLQKMLGG